MLYKWPVVPVAFSSNIEGIMVDFAFSTKQDKHEIYLAAWRKGRELLDYKKIMNGVCV